MVYVLLAAGLSVIFGVMDVINFSHGELFALGAYFALIRKVGAARAAYVGVMATVVALLVSAALEGYDWTFATAIGIALAVAGNVLAMNRRSVESAA